MMPQSHCFNGAELEYYGPLKVLTHHKIKEKTMLKSAGTSNLECNQHAVPGRKSLLACALLALLAGNQAMADVTIDDSVTPIVTDGSSILIENGLDSTSIEAGSILISDQNGNTVIVNPGNGIAVTDATSGGTSVITADGTGSNIYGNLTVEGDIGTVGQPVGTVNSTNIVNSGSVTSDTINATTITGGTITGSLDAAGSVVSNVGDGVAETDGVNVRQLNSMQGAFNNYANEVDSRFNAVDRRIDRVEEVANAGIASVAALAAIPSPAHGKRFSVGAGLGNYASESAVAVGFRAAITESTSVTAGVSRNTASKTAANLGVGYSW